MCVVSINADHLMTSLEPAAKSLTHRASPGFLMLAFPVSVICHLHPGTSLLKQHATCLPIYLLWVQQKSVQICTWDTCGLGEVTRTSVDTMGDATGSLAGSDSFSLIVHSKQKPTHTPVLQSCLGDLMLQNLHNSPNSNFFLNKCQILGHLIYF